MGRQLNIHRAWLVFIGVCVFNFIGYGLIVNCFGVFLVPTSQGLNISVTQVSLTHTVRAIFGTLGSLIAGRLMRRIDIRKYLSGVCVLIVLASLLTIRAEQLWQLLVTAAIMGLAVGMGVYTLVPLVITEWFTRPSGYIGVATACGGAGAVVFSPILSHLIGYWDWRAGYWLIAAVALLLMLPTAILLIRYQPKELGLKPYEGRQGQEPEGRSFSRPPEQGGDSLGQALKKPLFYVIIVFFIAAALVSGAFSHIPAMLRSKGYDLIESGYLNSFYQFGATGAQFIIGILLVRFGLVKVLGGCSLLICLGIAGFAALGQGAAAIALCVFIMGFGRAVGVVGGPVLVLKSFGRAHYSSIFSTLYAVYLGTVALSTTLYGGIFDASGSYKPAYIMMMVCSVLTSILIVRASAMFPRGKE